MATYRSKDMVARRKNSVTAKTSVKNSWHIQAFYVIVLSPVDILYKNLGMQAEVNEISSKEKFWRKKYIAVLR